MYLTLNTEVFEFEMRSALYEDRVAAKADVDAIITADVGFSRLLKRIGAVLNACFDGFRFSGKYTRNLYDKKDEN